MTLTKKWLRKKNSKMETEMFDGKGIFHLHVQQYSNKQRKRSICVT